MLKLLKFFCTQLNFTELGIIYYQYHKIVLLGHLHPSFRPIKRSGALDSNRKPRIYPMKIATVFSIRVESNSVLLLSPPNNFFLC